ncbi:MAG: hypothetical protein EBZ89_15490 [Chloroflexi bacterium]|nr:hypothetical protein [Chloroflexota bacterium]
MRSFWDTLDAMTLGVPEHPVNGLDPLIGLRPNWLSESVVLRRPTTDASPIASLQNPTGVPFSELGSRQLFVQNEDFGWVIGKDAHGHITAVHAQYLPDSKSGTPGADQYKVKGNIHWVSAAHAYEAEVRLYDRLYREAHPDAGGRDHTAALNPESLRVIRAQLEPGLAQAQPEARFQFERHGYFVVDRIDSKPGAPVFNRAVSLKDSWGSAKTAG